MLHWPVCENLRQSPIAEIVIGHNNRAVLNVIHDCAFKIRTCHSIQNQRSGVAATLYERNNARFSLFASTANVFGFTADVGFIDFYDALQHSGERWIRQSVPNPVHHKERCAIRTKSKHPLNLEGADSLFGT